MRGSGELLEVGRRKSKDCSAAGVVGSVARGLKSCNVVAHHAEEVPLRRLVCTGRDDDADEASFPQEFNVSAERSALPDENPGIWMFALYLTKLLQHFPSG